MSPNSLTGTVRTVSRTSTTVSPAAGSRARTQLQKKRPAWLVRFQISAGARRQPYFR